MLTEKYKEEFLDIYNVGNNMGNIIETIIETEKEINVELLQWNDEQVILYLKKFDSVSPVSVSKTMVTLRKFANLICTRENLEKREYGLDDGMLIKLINQDQLLSLTLSYEQYRNIKNQLDFTQLDRTQNENKVNVRDKLIFELAWQGLTNNDMKMLKETDVEFVENAVILNLINNTIRIEDPEVIEDIKLCLKETYCIRTAADGRTKQTYYKISDYLIKPIAVGRTSPKTYLDNPQVALRAVLRKKDITCPGIDVDNLTLEDIRRSKLIYLLSPENKEFFDLKTVSAIFGLKVGTTLLWLKHIAKMKYKV